MMRSLGSPVVFDVTHSLQLPGRRRRGHRRPRGIHRAAGPAGVAAGIDGVFLEVHEEPAKARSDAQNALALDRLAPFCEQLIRHQPVVKAAAPARPDRHA